MYELIQHIYALKKFYEEYKINNPEARYKDTLSQFQDKYDLYSGDLGKLFSLDEIKDNDPKIGIFFHENWEKISINICVMKNYDDI